MCVLFVCVSVCVVMYQNDRAYADADACMHCVLTGNTVSCKLSDG
jgi:hypothetical protein